MIADTVVRQLFETEASTYVYPGHDYKGQKSTTIGIGKNEA